MLWLKMEAKNLEVYNVDFAVKSSLRMKNPWSLADFVPSNSRIKC